MKNRKKRLMKIGAVIAVIAVAGIAGGVVICKGANRFELTVAGDLISKEEYVNCMNSVEYDTKIQIQQDYDAVYGTDFWEKQYDGQYGYEILARNTIEQLKYIHAVYDLAEENGDVEDSCYEALEKRWKDGNAERSEKVEKGEVIYGLKEYTFQLYLDYELSTLKILIMVLVLMHHREQLQQQIHLFTVYFLHRQAQISLLQWHIEYRRAEPLRSM